MRTDPWTERELQVLRFDAEGRVPLKETALKLGRSYRAVKTRRWIEGVGDPAAVIKKKDDAGVRALWMGKLPAMRAAIREAVEQSA